MTRQTTAVYEIWIEEKEEVDLILDNIKLFTGASLLKVKDAQYSGYDLEIMLENPTHLFILGKYVGCDKKRIYNKDC